MSDHLNASKPLHHKVLSRSHLRYLGKYDKPRLKGWKQKGKGNPRFMTRTSEGQFLRWKAVADRSGISLSMLQRASLDFFTDLLMLDLDIYNEMAREIKETSEGLGISPEQDDEDDDTTLIGGTD